MEENKRKIIEERLFQLFAKNDQDKNENQLTKNISSGVKVIRRRKGKPDLHISWKKAFKAERSAFGWSGRGHLSPASGHVLEHIMRQGLQVMAELFRDLGEQALPK